MRVFSVGSLYRYLTLVVWGVILVGASSLQAYAEGMHESFRPRYTSNEDLQGLAALGGAIVHPFAYTGSALTKAVGLGGGGYAARQDYAATERHFDLMDRLGYSNGEALYLSATDSLFSTQMAAIYHEGTDFCGNRYSDGERLGAGFFFLGSNALNAYGLSRGALGVMRAGGRGIAPQLIPDEANYYRGSISTESVPALQKKVIVYVQNTTPKTKIGWLFNTRHAALYISDEVAGAHISYGNASRVFTRRGVFDPQAMLVLDVSEDQMRRMVAAGKQMKKSPFKARSCATAVTEVLAAGDVRLPRRVLAPSDLLSVMSDRTHQIRGIASAQVMVKPGVNLTSYTNMALGKEVLMGSVTIGGSMLAVQAPDALKYAKGLLTNGGHHPNMFNPRRSPFENNDGGY